MDNRTKSNYNKIEYCLGNGLELFNQRTFFTFFTMSYPGYSSIFNQFLDKFTSHVIIHGDQITKSVCTFEV